MPDLSHSFEMTKGIPSTTEGCHSEERGDEESRTPDYASVHYVDDHVGNGRGRSLHSDEPAGIPEILDLSGSFDMTKRRSVSHCAR
jgi:hypothetical protein